MVVDGFDVGTEIELASHASDDCRQQLHIREADVYDKTMATGKVSDLDRAHGSVDFDGAKGAIAIDDFDAGNGSRAQEGDHAIPVIGRAIAKPQGYAVLFLP